jgi:hypothetical protein
VEEELCESLAQNERFHALVLQPHFEASVRMKLTLPKMGTWSPSGLPKTQSLIAGVKTPRIEVFFILLERS